MTLLAWVRKRTQKNTLVKTAVKKLSQESTSLWKEKTIAAKPAAR